MRNKLIRFFALLMVSLALLSAPVISGSYDTPFAVTVEAASKKTPAISAKKKTVYYKSKVTLKINNYKGKVKWSTSNKKVATVNSKGEVTGVALGECTITAKAGKKTYKCTVIVKDRNVSSSVGIKVNGGGYFVKGESTAKVTVKPKKYNAAKATVVIKNASGTTVYKKTLTQLEKNKTYSFDWDGKNTKGKYVSTGSYTVKVKIGEKTSSSSAIKFYAKNDFAGGNGSKKNPFVVSSTSQLMKIVKYPDGYFKQLKNLNFAYNSIGDLFTVDQPFNGVYNGNGMTMSNVIASAPLFRCIGEKGTVKNLKIVSYSVVSENGAVLAYDNYGKITNCTIDGNVAVRKNGSGNQYLHAAIAAVNNYGTIADSVFTGNVSCYAGGDNGKAYAAGIVGVNQQSGKIISCTSSVDVAAECSYGSPLAGGIAAINQGVINDCEASGALSGSSANSHRVALAGVAVQNFGQVIGSYYTGINTVDLVSDNKGTVV